MNRIETPQFRSELVKKLKNIYPDHEIIIINNLKQGIGFQLKKHKSSQISEIVKINRYHEQILTKKWLMQSVVFSTEKPS